MLSALSLPASPLVASGRLGETVDVDEVFTGFVKIREIGDDPADGPDLVT